MQTIPLPDFEIEILNKVIGTRAFGEYNDMKEALKKHVEEQKDKLIASGEVAENDFSLSKVHIVDDMIHFLVRNEFYAVREGGVYFLTDKGKYLQKQRSLQGYLQWETAREEKLIKDMHTIEERGYLDEDQTFKKEHVAKAPVVMDDDNKKNFGWYILIIIVLIILAAIGKSNKWWIH